jgi:hypothetical protein
MTEELSEGVPPMTILTYRPTHDLCPGRKKQQDVISPAI